MLAVGILYEVMSRLMGFLRLALTFKIKLHQLSCSMMKSLSIYEELSNDHDNLNLGNFLAENINLQKFSACKFSLIFARAS